VKSEFANLELSPGHPEGFIFFGFLALGLLYPRAGRNRPLIEVLVGSGRPGGAGTGMSSLADYT